MSNKDKIQPRLLNIGSTAKFLGISPKTIRNRLGPKAPDPFPLKPKRIGRKVLFDIKKYGAFVQNVFYFCNFCTNVIL